MLAALRTERWWLVANAVGAVLFLYLASKTWIEPELRNIPGASVGNTISWSLTALLVALLFLLINFTWLVRIILRAVRDKAYLSLVVVSFVGVVWIATAYFDNLHHGS